MIILNNPPKVQGFIEIFCIFLPPSLFYRARHSLNRFILFDLFQECS